jgi:hypothetical protein
MRIIVPLLLLASALPLSTPAHAVKHDQQFWIGADGTVKLSTKWRLSDDVSVRFSDKKDGLYQVINSTLLGYAVTDKITLWGGYTHDLQYSDGDVTAVEHRAREQVTIAQLARLGGGTFDARLRMEERWREHGDGTAWRIRPFIRYVAPFKVGRTTAAVLVSHEDFINFNSTSFQASSGYDRMRNFVGISAPMTKHTKLQFGYLNQYTFVRGGEDTMDHIASVSLGGTF